MKKISHKFYQGTLTIINFSVITFLPGIALKLEDLAQSFQVSIHVHSCMPSIATDDSKQFQCLDIILNNKTGPIFFEIN